LEIWNGHCAEFLSVSFYRKGKQATNYCDCERRVFELHGVAEPRTQLLTYVSRRQRMEGRDSENSPDTISNNEMNN
jgi:hypothetical protein